jgi:branched-subunit amino acid ABC-type transport system permease component
LKYALLYSFRADTRTIDDRTHSRRLTLDGLSSLSHAWSRFVAAFAVAMALWFLMTFTDIGRAIRAGREGEAWRRTVPD